MVPLTKAFRNDGGSMDFSELDPSEVLSEAALPEYVRGMDFFYLGQLVPLNATMYIVEQVLEFPLELFVGPGEGVFYTLLLDNFLSAGLLAITRLATDSSKDLYTLMRFKNWLAQQVAPKFAVEFHAYLKQSRFDKRTREMLGRAKGLRDARVAHLLTGTVLGNTESDRVNVMELGALRDALNALLRTLSFNRHRAMLPVPYHPDVVYPPGTRSDIERILDSTARESWLLNLPEKNPHHWAAYRLNLSGECLRTMNRYRVKFGLPEAE